MASESGKLFHLFAVLVALFLLFSNSMQDPSESDLCNFEDETQLDDLSQNQTQKKVNVVMNGEELGDDKCHFIFNERSGECKCGADCGHACAALGLNPNAVKCIPSSSSSSNSNPHSHPTPPNRCCCLVSPKQN